MKIILYLLPLLLYCGTINAQGDSLASRVYTWSNAPVQKRATGEGRNVLKGQTMDLSSLGVHTSTLLPGIINHPPVAYNDREEMVIIKEGSLEAKLNDSTFNLGAGSLIFMAAGDMQSFRNNTANPVTYYVITLNSKKTMPKPGHSDTLRSIARDWNKMLVKKTEKGASRPVFDTKTQMFTRLDAHVTTLNAGIASHAPHVHRTEEMIILIEGSGEMQIGQEKQKAIAGDIIFLEGNVLHAFTNTGSVPCSYFAIQWHQEQEF